MESETGHCSFFACSNFSAAESICPAVTHAGFPPVPQFITLANVAIAPALRSFDRHVAGVLTTLPLESDWHGTFANSVDPFVASVILCPW